MLDLRWWCRSTQRFPKQATLDIWGFMRLRMWWSMYMWRWDMSWTWSVKRFVKMIKDRKYCALFHSEKKRTGYRPAVQCDRAHMKNKEKCNEYKIWIKFKKYHIIPPNAAACGQRRWLHSACMCMKIWASTGDDYRQKDTHHLWALNLTNNHHNVFLYNSLCLPLFWKQFAKPMNMRAVFTCSSSTTVNYFKRA